MFRLEGLLELSRENKKVLAQIADAVCLFFAMLLSVSLRYGEIYVPSNFDILLGLLITVGLTITVATKIGMLQCSHTIFWS